MADSADLLARIRDAQGADREIDHAIFVACFGEEACWPVLPDGDVSAGYYYRWPPSRTTSWRPEFTKDIGAALALVEAKLPTAGWEHEKLEMTRTNGRWVVTINYRRWPKGGEPEYFASYGEGATASLAVLACLLLALQSQEPSHVQAE